LDRLEQVVGILAESHISLERVVAELATETRRGFDQVAAQFAAVTKRMDEDRAHTEERFRETDERFREMARENSQRSRELDERVDKLVLAIGELIRK
jgi:uncharacterized membrane-anchored protein YhcB (DUF1043 family)